MAQAIEAQEIARQRRDLVVVPGGGRMDPVQESAERRGELAGLMVWRLIGHARTSSFGGPPAPRPHSRAYRPARTAPAALTAGSDPASPDDEPAAVPERAGRPASPASSATAAMRARPRQVTITLRHRCCLAERQPSACSACGQVICWMSRMGCQRPPVLRAWSSSGLVITSCTQWLNPAAADPARPAAARRNVRPGGRPNAAGMVLAAAARAAAALPGQPAPPKRYGGVTVVDRRQ